MRLVAWNRLGLIGAALALLAAGCKSGDPVTTTAVPAANGQKSGLKQYHEV